MPRPRSILAPQPRTPACPPTFPTQTPNSTARDHERPPRPGAPGPQRLVQNAFPSGDLGVSRRLYSAEMGDVWITGIGLLTALGPDRETTWRRLTAGETGIRPITLFDTTGFRTTLAAQIDVAGLPDPQPGLLPKHSTRASHFALLAAREALEDAGLQADGELSWGLAFGGGTAGLFEAEDFVARRLRRGPRARGLGAFLEVPQDAPADRVAAAFSLIGPRLTVTTACSSSTIAVGRAAEMIREGEVDVALAGGSDALCRLTFAGFNSLRAVDSEPCKPFDRRRKGLSLGEGAAVLVLENADRARARGARAYAAVLGYGVTNDAFHMTQPEPTGAAWARTLRAAFTDGGVTPEAIDYINAHGTATEQNDPAECAAYARVFGARLAQMPVSTVKGALGHCLCGAGGIEAAITALAISRQIAPPTVGFAEADPACPIDPVPARGREVRIRTALSCSFAFGGNSAAIALEAVR